MEPKSRFDRDVDPWEPTQATSRFERLDKGPAIVERLIREKGGELVATLEDGRISVYFGGYGGLFPSFNLGVEAIGEAFDEDSEEVVVTSLPGACSSKAPVDQFLMDGGTLTITSLGNRLFVVATRKLPNRSFTYQGAEHHVFRKGTRRGQGDNLIEAIEATLASEEGVLEGSLLPT